MLKEQLVLTTVQAAVAIAKKPAGPQQVMPEQVARMVDFFLDVVVVRRPTMTGATRSCSRLSAVVGCDEPWLEGGGHVPWYAD